MARNDPQLVVKLPAELKYWVVQKAVAEQRSQNFVVVEILKSAKAGDEARKAA